MKEIEIYQDLLKKTEGKEIKTKRTYSDLPSLNRLLVLTDVTDTTLEGIQYNSFKSVYEELFCDFRPKRVTKNGTYLVQLNRVLEKFEPEHTAPFKNFTKSVLSASKYLSQFKGYNDFCKEVYLKCIDEDSTIKFLSDFRSESSLQSMYFVKTCEFFQHSSILDCPIPSLKAKEYLSSVIDLPDDNISVYKMMKEIAKKNNISCFELNERINNA